MQLRAICIMGVRETRSVRDALERYVEGDVIVCHALKLPDEMSTLHHDADVILYDPAIDNGRFLHIWYEEADRLPALVCVSTDRRFVIEAFEVGVLHYVVDCADERAIVTAMRRVEYHAAGVAARPCAMPAAYGAHAASDVIALPTPAAIDIHRCEHIVRVHGEGNYSRVYLQDEAPVVLCRTIGEWECTLDCRMFVRVHRSHLVNLMHVRKILRGKRQRLRMSNGDEIEVSEKYREALYARVRLIGRRRL